MSLTNGKKPSAIAIIATIGVIISIILSLTNFGDRIFKRGAVSAIIAQTVDDNKKAIKENHDKTELDIRAILDTLSSHNTDIEVVKTEVVNLAEKVQAQTTATNKGNDLLIEVLKRLPPE